MSPDGLVGDLGLIEVKGRMAKYQVQTILEHIAPPDAASIIPMEFMLQVQDGLFVTEREWCDFISYSNGLNMAVIRVRPIEEYQVAKRAKRDPKAVKALLQQCWAQSDSKGSFTVALRENGFALCRGDRRGFVAVDAAGNSSSTVTQNFTYDSSVTAVKFTIDDDKLPLENTLSLLQDADGAKRKKAGLALNRPRKITGIRRCIEQHLRFHADRV